MKYHKLVIVPLFVLLAIAPSGVGNAASLIALKNGNIRSGPGINYKIIGKVHKWEVIELGRRVEDSGWIGTWYQERGEMKKGWDTKYQNFVMPGALGEFAPSLETGDLEKGVFVKYSGKVQVEKGLSPTSSWSVQEVYYKPIISGYKYIHKSIVTIVNGSKEYNLNRMSRIRQAGWAEKRKIECAKQIVKIGMTKEMVFASWGKPNDINRTVTMHGTRVQWVYGGYASHSKPKYLYFEKDKLTSFQD